MYPGGYPMSKPTRIRPSSPLLRIEPFETRTLLSTCVVNNLGDTGLGRVPLLPQWGSASGDLRFCINRVNNLPGPDTIQLDVIGIINLNSALPDLSSDIDIEGPGGEQIDGTTQFECC